jgi:hypothetical protein
MGFSPFRKVRQMKSNKIWITLRGLGVQVFAHLAFWGFLILAALFIPIAIFPSEFKALFVGTSIVLNWGTRLLFFLLGIGSIYVAIKCRVLLRYGKKIAAIKDSIDLSESDFSFETTEAGVQLNTLRKTYALGKTVLYLRSFQIDHEKGVDEGTEDATYEEQVANILSDIGQLVCIGHPAEPLPEPGALRLYYKNQDEGWKRIVMGLLPTSQLIVLRAGTSAGLNWEMEQVKSFVNPERFVVLILGPIADRLKALKILEEVFQMDIDVPDEDFIPERNITKKRVEAPFYHGYIVHFDANWQPKLEIIPLHLGCWHGLFFDDSRTATTRLKLAFQPIFKRLGFRWRLPISWLSVISIGWVLFILLFLLFAFFYKKVTGHGIFS